MSLDIVESTPASAALAPISVDDLLSSALVHLSPKTRSIYTARWLDYYNWWHNQPQPKPQLFSRFSMQQYLRARHFSNSADVVRSVLAAVKAVAEQAEANGTIDTETLVQIRTLKPPKKQGVKSGRWLTKEQAAGLLQAAADNPSGTMACRDLALLALMLGCGLRRSELCNLCWSQFEETAEGWVIRNLVGKGNRTRTIKVPAWCWQYIVRWGNQLIEQGEHNVQHD